MAFSMKFGKNESNGHQMKSAESHTVSTLRSNFQLADQVKENSFAPFALLKLCTEISLEITYRPDPDLFFFLSLHVTLHSR